MGDVIYTIEQEFEKFDINVRFYLKTRCCCAIRRFCEISRGCIAHQRRPNTIGIGETLAVNATVTAAANSNGKRVVMTLGWAFVGYYILVLRHHVTVS